MCVGVIVALTVGVIVALTVCVSVGVDVDVPVAVKVKQDGHSSQYKLWSGSTVRAGYSL